MFAAGSAGAAGVQAAGSVASSALDFFGRQEANTSNTRNMREQNQFNMARAHEAMAYNTAISREQGAFNLAAMRENLGFQERMSNSAYQRQVADMQKAGINPILAASSGGGASSPSGSSASMSAPSAPSAHASSTPQMQSRFGGMSHAALEVASTLAQIKNMQETNKNIAQDTKVKAAAEGTQKAQTNLYSNSADKVAKETKIVAANTPKAEAHGRVWQAVNHVADNLLGSSAKEHRNFRDYMRSEHPNLMRFSK